MDPITVCRYGSQSMASVSMVIMAAPYGWLSTRSRRSSFTTSRSRWKFSSFTTRLCIRSASSHSATFTWFDGTVSK